MAEFQARHWRRMIDIVDEYLGGRLELGALVGALESSLHASELKDEQLKRLFMDHWAPFEIAYAVAREMGTAIDDEQMKAAAVGMKTFLSRTLDEVTRASL